MNRAKLSSFARPLETGLFAVFLGVLLLTHTTRATAHILVWWPIPLPPPFSETEWRIGIISLLPGVIILASLVGGRRSHHVWRSHSALLLLALGILTLLALPHIRTLEATVLLVPLGLCWFVLIYTTRADPGREAEGLPIHRALAGALVLVVYLQAGVGVVQFLRQGEVGLSWLGEPVLDLALEETALVLSRGENLLRAYGLNSHPNQFGMKMAVILLILIPGIASPKKWLRIAVIGACLAGAAGLLLSFSRSALLAALVGGGVYVLKSWWGMQSRPSLSARQRWLLGGLVIGGVLVVAVVSGDAWVGRFFDLDNPLESRSISERSRDLPIALELIRRNPIIGAGLMDYASAAAQLDPEAGLVHNVLVRMGAELGLPGLAAWAFFCLAPLALVIRKPREIREVLDRYATPLAVWLALLTISMVQPEPYLLNIQGAVLWGLAVALWLVAGGSKHRTV